MNTIEKIKLTAIFFASLIANNSYSETIFLTCSVRGSEKSINGTIKLEPKDAILNITIEDEGKYKYIDGDGPADYAFGILHPSKNDFSQDYSDKNKWHLSNKSSVTGTESTMQINRITGSFSMVWNFNRTNSIREISGQCSKVNNNKKF